MSTEQVRPELDSLVERCGLRDRRAWEVLIPQIQEGLRRVLVPWLRRRFPGEDAWCLAEEFVQDLFLECWRSPKRLTGFRSDRGTLCAFLATLLRQRVAKVLQRRHGPVATSLPADLQVIDYRLDLAEVDALVAEFLTQLPPQAAVVLQRFHLHVPTEADWEATTPAAFWQTTHDLKGQWEAFYRGE